MGSSRPRTSRKVKICRDSWGLAVETLETHGPERKDLHDGEENGPPHRKGNQNTYDSVSNEASGSASRVEEGREETRQDVEDRHSEDMDQPEAHIEEPGCRPSFQGQLPYSE